MAANNMTLCVVSLADQPLPLLLCNIYIWAWALDKVKKDAAPGKDGVTVDMMSADVLFDVWCALFEVCWEYGMVPSVWRESLVVPVPQKRSRGTCVTDSFRGISLTSSVSKVLCVILNARLTDVAEGEGLIAEEQGGFRKQRGCRDQVLTLVLMGQTEIAKAAKGMLVASSTSLKLMTR